VHLFDTALSTLTRINPCARVTLNFLLGKPLCGGPVGKSAQHNQQEDASVQGTADSTLTLPGTGLVTIDTSHKTKLVEGSWNPRVREDELWYPHTNDQVVQKLIAIVRNHYPERLHRVLLVAGSGFRFARTALGRNLAIRRALPDTKLRSRVVYIARYKDIHKFVEPTKIPAFAGGTADQAVIQDDIK
jgi:CRAL/TRIO domain